MKSLSNHIARRLRNLCLAALLALASLNELAARVSGQDKTTSGLLAGAAIIDITPSGPVRLSGFGFRRTESEGVNHPIHARALALSDASGRPFVLIAVDNCGIPWSITAEVARRLADAGVCQDRLCLVATHTHTAPMLDGVLRTIFGEPIPPEHQERIRAYTRELVDKLEQVARDAMRAMRPAQLKLARGTLGFAMNRRTAGGPVDHDLPAIIICDENEQVIAVSATYACHCVTLSHNLVGGDWAGYAAEFLERQYPNAVGLVSIGCGADQNPDSGVTGDKVAAAQQQGADFAAAVERVFAQAAPVHAATLLPRQSVIELKLAPPRTMQEWQDRVAQGGAVGFHAQTWLDRIAAGQSLPEKIAYPVTTWKLGRELALVFLPGEVVVDYALRLKKEFAGQNVVVIAYANDTPCYIPSERVLREGGYEGEGAMVYYDLPQALAPGLEDQIIATVHQQLSPEFLPTPDPAKADPAWTDPDKVPTPEQVLQSLHVAEGFVVDLVAAEPLIRDPVAIQFGTEGELWVCQMGDYPTGIDGQFTAGGEIRRLTDTDQDGRFDHASVFLKGVPFPTGVLPWRDGILVCAAPDILFAADHNHDGEADEVKKLFSGFATHNYHARVNSLRYGLDGWVYGSCGLFGGKITTPENPVPVDVQGRDFRIDPDRGLIEPVIGQTQQGRARNDWGDWFGCDNSMLARHYPIVEHYLARNRAVLPPTVSIPISASADPGEIFCAGDPTLLPLSGPKNRVTAACGLTVYRDVRLGRDFENDLFVCESVGNIVHHIHLTPNGVSWSGSRRPQERQKEFLASRSPWFRPVEAITGPDGGLWVVDMCRWVIEHPQWIPPEVLETLDVRAGWEHGRIFRVMPANTTPAPFPDFSKLSPAKLAGWLNTSNGTLRDLAMQVILWSEDASAAAPELRQLVRDRPSASIRLQALCTLDQLDQLSAEDLQLCLGDEEPGVRKNAIRIAEAGKYASLWTDILAQVESEDDVSVLQQLAWSLGTQAERGVEGLVAIIDRRGDEPCLFAAACSSLNAQTVNRVCAGLLDRWERAIAGTGDSNNPGENAPSTELVAEVVALTCVLDPDSAKEGFEKFLAVVERHPSIDALSSASSLVQRFRNHGCPEELFRVLLSGGAATRIMKLAESVAGDDTQDANRRITALKLCGMDIGRDDSGFEWLPECLEPQAGGDLQRAAIEFISGRASPTLIEQALQRWPALAPKERTMFFDAMLSQNRTARILLVSLEGGRFPLQNLDSTRRWQLCEHPDPEVRSLAAKLLDAPLQSARSAVVTSYESSLDLAGDAENGRQVFRKSCAGCHTLEGHGCAVGPDLAMLANRSPRALLDSILDPGRNLDPRYQQYAVVLDDGRMYTGMLVDETSNGFWLAGRDDARYEIRRDQIDELRSTNKSLMPEGMEQELPQPLMADLLAYLVKTRAPRKTFEGNDPVVVAIAPSGETALPARQSSIFGGEIAYEAGPDAIGYWHDENDFCEWTVEVARTGSYEISLEYSCADDCAGNTVVVEVGAAEIAGKVPSTGSWQIFQTLPVGNVNLEAGKSSIVVRARSPMTQRALLDLKALKLVRKEDP
jgi:putative membrane-bound dehydrogenase-like protein